MHPILAISESARKKSEGKSASYQDSVTASLAREDDDDGEEDEDEDEDQEGDSGQGGRKLQSIKKLRSIIRSIRSSPQRRQAWLEDVKASHSFKAGRLGKQPLMLILDVKTRWSSTHQMLRRAIDHRQIITDFSIILVTGWLKSFRTATTLMSTTKRPMLSYTHAIFRGLQEDLRVSLNELPFSTPSVLRNGLLDAHRKLSDYYYKSDDSHFYTWAALLDPRISRALTRTGAALTRH
ncbi:hypothetical protein B0H11DRAFT_2217997 [Mycena galericulata]|nr:hypothetical protein B0H11DRAFT_2217997 [Mycena galericulata]